MPGLEELAQPLLEPRDDPVLAQVDVGRMGHLAGQLDLTLADRDDEAEGTSTGDDTPSAASADRAPGGNACASWTPWVALPLDCAPVRLGWWGSHFCEITLSSK